jgi:protein-S-isoprenylcysteine O-methyltransferase Ste14
VYRVPFARKGVETMIQVDAFPDQEERVISPPLLAIAASAIAIASLLQWLLPIDIVAELASVEDIDPDWLAGVGGVVAAAGLLLSVRGCYALKRWGGVIDPWQMPKALVTDGVFQWTRNPCYLGILIALSGAALIFALDWLLILIIPTWTILHYTAVRSEEAFLNQKFGRSYQVYAKRVPRYLFIH